MDSMNNEQPWYIETWYDEDLEIALEEADLEPTKENVEELKKRCLHIFDNKSGRRDELAQVAAVYAGELERKRYGGYISMSVMTLSMAHISNKTYVKIINRYKQITENGLRVFPDDKGNWLVGIPEDDCDIGDDLPDDLNACVNRAIEYECDWIMFGFHEPIVRDLPVYR